MITWGITALNHGSSLAVFSSDHLVMFAVCDSDHLDDSLVYSAKNYGGPSKIFWYENPWLKKTRQLRAGQWDTARDFSVLPSRYIKKLHVPYTKLRYTPHHASHAAAGYYTSGFSHATVVVADAIGEWNSTSIWSADRRGLKKLWTSNYPNSLGLFYSAFAKLIGLTPIKQENILEQMSHQGDPDRFYADVSRYFKGTLRSTRNLHRGVRDWPHALENLQDQCDLAAAVQRVFEQQVSSVMQLARGLNRSNDLVYMGGCAMNKTANSKVVDPIFDNRWTLPNSGDMTSSIGAVAYHNNKMIDKETVKRLVIDNKIVYNKR